MRHRFVIALASLLLLVGAIAPTATTQVQAQCGTRVAAVSPQIAVASPTHFFDKTRFLLHAGAAFFAFHHFVYKRYQEGGFASNASGRKFNFVKAAIALVFAYHELHVAYTIADGSSSKTLHALVTPINAVLGLFDREKTNLTNGAYNPSDLTNVNNSVTSLGNQASGAGYGIKDVPVPVPGAA